MNLKALTLVVITIVVTILPVSTGLAVSTNPEDWPSTLTFKNKTVPTPSTNSNGWVNPSTNPNMGGEWVRRDDWSGTGYIAYTKTLPDNTVLWLDVQTSGDTSIQLSYFGAEEGWPEFWTLGFSGPDLASLELTRVEPNFNDLNGPDETEFRDWAASTFATLGFDSLIAGGISEDGSTFLAGGDPNSPNESNGGGDVIVDQAQQLNIGLEFNDGQWTPVQ